MLKLEAYNHWPITLIAKGVFRSCALIGSISCFKWDWKIGLWHWQRGIWELSSYNSSRRILVSCMWDVLASSLGNRLAPLAAWICRNWYAEVHMCQLSEGRVTLQMCWQLQLPKNFLRKYQVSLENIRSWTLNQYFKGNIIFCVVFSVWSKFSNNTQKLQVSESFYGQGAPVVIKAADIWMPQCSDKCQPIELQSQYFALPCPLIMSLIQANYVCNTWETGGELQIFWQLEHHWSQRPALIM